MEANYFQILLIHVTFYLAVMNRRRYLKVIYHPLYSMNKFVTTKSKLPQDGAQVFSYIAKPLKTPLRIYVPRDTS